MKPSNSFIDESIMNKSGEPLEYVPVFSRHCPGLIVKEATREEWDNAIMSRSSTSDCDGTKARNSSTDCISDSVDCSHNH